METPLAGFLFDVFEGLSWHAREIQISLLSLLIDPYISEMAT